MKSPKNGTTEKSMRALAILLTALWTLPALFPEVADCAGDDPVTPGARWALGEADALLDADSLTVHRALAGAWAGDRETASRVVGGVPDLDGKLRLLETLADHACLRNDPDAASFWLDRYEAVADGLFDRSRRQSCNQTLLRLRAASGMLEPALDAWVAVQPAGRKNLGDPRTRLTALRYVQDCQSRSYWSGMMRVGSVLSRTRAVALAHSLLPRDPFRTLGRTPRPELLLAIHRQTVEALRKTNPATGRESHNVLRAIEQELRAAHGAVNALLLTGRVEETLSLLNRLEEKWTGMLKTVGLSDRRDITCHLFDTWRTTAAVLTALSGDSRKAALLFDTHFEASGAKGHVPYSSQSLHDCYLQLALCLARAGEVSEGFERIRKSYEWDRCSGREPFLRRLFVEAVLHGERAVEAELAAQLGLSLENPRKTWNGEERRSLSLALRATSRESEAEAMLPLAECPDLYLADFFLDLAVVTGRKGDAAGATKALREAAVRFAAGVKDSHGAAFRTLDPAFLARAAGAGAEARDLLVAAAGALLGCTDERTNRPERLAFYFRLGAYAGGVGLEPEMRAWAKAQAGPEPGTSGSTSKKRRFSVSKIGKPVTADPASLPVPEKARRLGTEERAAVFLGLAVGLAGDGFEPSDVAFLSESLFSDHRP